MKQLLTPGRNTIRTKALYSSATLSFFIYIIIRGFAFDFPMTWPEEFSLFLKVLVLGTLLISLGVIGCAGLYNAFEKMKRR